jgi:uncharacterized LabA/DUF88 family protein
MRKAYFGSGPTAILVDIGFFLFRYKACYPGKDRNDPRSVAADLYTIMMKHVEDQELYRIFVYDCPPFEGKAQNPISGKTVNFQNTEIAKFRKQFHEELIRKRKIALRRGTIKITNNWHIQARKMKELFKHPDLFTKLSEDDVYYEMTQKGVDMRMGLDIASLAYKKLVKTIILVTGDSDFVPAAKLARREGIDVILDPMWQVVSPSLHEHVDGVQSTCAKPKAI